MTIKPEFSEYIRTVIRGDNEASDRIQAELDATGWGDYAKFQAALFFLAVERRFNRKIVDSEIITFVAGLRSDVSDGGPRIDPEGAEALIKATIDPDLDYDVSQAMIGTIQGATIYKVFTEANLTDSELDNLLRDAARLAEQAS